jgi:hypothetical protein
VKGYKGIISAIGRTKERERERVTDIGIDTGRGTGTCTSTCTGAGIDTVSTLWGKHAKEQHSGHVHVAVVEEERVSLLCGAVQEVYHLHGGSQVRTATQTQKQTPSK